MSLGIVSSTCADLVVQNCSFVGNIVLWIVHSFVVYSTAHEMEWQRLGFDISICRPQGYSPRHLDFEVLNEIQPFFSYEPNQSKFDAIKVLMESRSFVVLSIHRYYSCVHH